MNGAVRFNSDCWIQVWITEDELKQEEKVQEILKNKSGDLQTKEKIELIKDIACQIAIRKIRKADKELSKYCRGRQNCTD